MQFEANAKINLGLNIVEKRSDGFHNIESIFLPINWSDRLTIELSDRFQFSSSGIYIPGEEKENLCIKAYELIQADYAISPVSIHLEKKVPIGAGLGGGSSDAAYTLIAIDECFGLGCTTGQLQDYARILGSDCAFFIENEPSYCFGKGDQFEEINFDLNSYKIILINPSIHVSTVTAYGGVIPESPKENLRTSIQRPIHEWKESIVNDFEKTVFEAHPEIEKIKQKLYEEGAAYASMSGSGSTVFGIFSKEKKVNFEHSFPYYQIYTHE